MYKLIFLLFYFSILTSCIEPIDINIDSGQSNNLVISGLVTDQEGPYKVEISLSSDFFDSNSQATTKVSDAIVTISDDQGQKFELQESNPGIYLTQKSELIGEVGRKYILTVQLEDGRLFQSLPEEMNPNAGIDSIYTEYNTNTVRNNQGNLITQNGLEVFIDSKSNSQAFHRWRWTGTYEVLTYPEQVVHPVFGPTPLPCSGYSFNGSELLQIAACECCTCWIEELSQTALVSDSKFNQTEQKRIFMNYIINDRNRVGNKYHINVEQISLSSTGYKFWNSVKSQQQQGSIFDTSLSITPTNIEGVNNNDLVLGYFGASSIKSSSKFVTLEARKIIPTEAVINSCLTLKNSTNVRPDFW